MASSLGLTTKFHSLTPEQRQRFERKGFELLEFGKAGNGVVVSKDWDPNRPTVLFCHGRDGNAGTGSYLNIATDIGAHKFGGHCNVAVVLHQAPGNQDSMVKDGLEAMDHLLTKRGKDNVAPEKVYLCGYSIGCVTASALARSFPDAARLTLLLPPTSVPEAAEYAFKNRGIGTVGRVVSWVANLHDRNHRNTVDYIAAMHGDAVTAKRHDVMPIEALLSKEDRVADPELFIKGLTERGVRDAVNVAIEVMQNSPTAHTNAFSLEKNFPQLLGSTVLHEERGRMAPISPIIQQGVAR